MGVNFLASFARNVLSGVSFRGWIYRCACLRFGTTDLVLIKCYEMGLYVLFHVRMIWRSVDFGFFKADASDRAA